MSRDRPSNALLPGETVRHFEILGPLGSGGMGVVYRARDRKLGREVALKFLPPHVAGSGEESRRFLREAQVASALDHPNICTVYAIDEAADGRVFIAMAAYDGQTLRQRLEQGPLPTPEWLNIAQQIAGGLTAAHNRGIVHRDIKPANVMLTEQGLVKILDFGLSKPTGPGDERSQLTRSGTILGTLAYISPEQIRGEPIGTASDIWSFGAVLYEMATGCLPFENTNDVSSLYSILSDEPKPPREHVPGISGLQERIILKALTKDLEDRYRDVDELIADLQELAGNGLSARGADVPSQTLVLRETSEPGSARKTSGPGLEEHGGHAPVAGVTRTVPLRSTPLPSTSPAIVGPRSWLRQARIPLAVIFLVALTIVGWLSLQLLDTPRDDSPDLPETRNRLIEARESLRRLDGSEALEILGEIAGREPVPAQVHWALSRAHRLLGREGLALEHARAAEEASQFLPAGFRGQYQAQVANLTREYKAAAEALEAYWLYKEKNGTWGVGRRLDAGLDLIRLRARTGRLDRAFELLTELLGVAPEDPRLPLMEAEIAPAADDRLAAANQALGLIRAEDQPLLQARALQLQGQALRRKGELKAAEPALEAAVEIYDATGHKADKASTLTILGNLAFDRGELTAARARYERAAQLYGEVGNSRLRARPLTNMALVLRELGDLEAATVIFRQALELQQQLDDRVGQIFTLVNLAGPLQMSGRLSEALEAASQAAALAETVEDTAARAHVLEVLGELHTLTGDLQQAASELSNMRDFARSSGDLHSVAQAEHRLGRVRHLEGDLEAAKEHFLTALMRFEEAEAPTAMGPVYEALAQTQLWIGDLDGCRDSLEKARELEENPSSIIQTGLRLSSAELLYFEGKTREAVRVARQTLEDISPERQIFRAVRGQEILARALLVEGRVSEAQEAIDRGARLLAGVDVPTYQIPNLLTSARIAVADGRSQEARDILQRALAMATIHGYKALDLKSRALLGKVELLTGNVRAGRARLEAVIVEAEARGLGRIARQARDVLARG